MLKFGGVLGVCKGGVAETLHVSCSLSHDNNTNQPQQQQQQPDNDPELCCFCSFLHHYSHKSFT